MVLTASWLCMNLNRQLSDPLLLQNYYWLLVYWQSTFISTPFWTAFVHKSQRTGYKTFSDGSLSFKWYPWYHFILESSSWCSNPQVPNRERRWEESEIKNRYSSVFSDIIEAVSAKLHLLHLCLLTTPLYTNERYPIHLHRAVCSTQTLHLSNCRQPLEQRSTYLS